MRSYIEVDKREIRHLLNRGIDEQLLVPIYQRDYVWKSKDGEEFFNDLLAGEDTKLFLGTFVFKKDSTGRQIEIVDGQQRITTVLIFLIACRVFAKNNGCSEKLINEIQRHIVSEFDREKSLLDTKPTDKITKPFQIMCQSSWSGHWTEEMQNEEGWKMISKSYNFFIKKIKRDIDDKDDRDNVIRNLLQRILNIEYIEITVKGAREAIDTFERVNARGQKLRTHELIKAFLFSESLDNQEMSVFIEEKWKKIDEYSSKYSRGGDLNLDNVLFYFYFSQKGYTQKFNLYRQLKELVRQDIKAFIEQLESFALFCSITMPEQRNLHESDLLRYLENKDGLNLSSTSIITEDSIKRIIRSIFAIGLTNIKPLYSLIYASLISLSLSVRKYGQDKEKVEEWIAFLEFLEDYYFVIAIIMHRTAQYGGALQEVYTKHCNNFNQKPEDFIEIIKQTKEDLSNIMSIDPAAFEASFIELDYISDIAIVHYVFDRLNNTDRETNKRVKPNEYLTTATMSQYKLRSDSVEHLLPQSGNYREDLESAKHNIGNLLVIHRGHNSSLGNKTPDEKVKQLKGWLDDGTIQNRKYIQDFLDYYQKEITDKGEEWNEQAIEQRGRDLAKRMYDITYYKEKK